jgi:phosphoribosylglycinamide formyltransferase-1
MKKVRLAIFASGTGSNAAKLMDYFKDHSSIEIAFVLTNKPQAPVVDKTNARGVTLITCTNQEVDQLNFMVNICHSNQIDFIILAGFLRKIPTDLIHQFENRIINVHPSLLPKFGGAGMYGLNVHNAVKEAGETESGITIHYVTENFDEGQRIAQFYTPIFSSETPEQIQHKIHLLEQIYFPIVIEQEINKVILFPPLMED